MNVAGSRSEDTTLQAKYRPPATMIFPGSSSALEDPSPAPARRNRSLSGHPSLCRVSVEGDFTRIASEKRAQLTRHSKTAWQFTSHLRKTACCFIDPLSKIPVDSDAIETVANAVCVAIRPHAFNRSAARHGGRL